MTKAKDKETEKKIAGDAAGQFAQGKHGAKNSGVSSAAPRVLTGDEDATFSKDNGTKEGR